MDGQLRVLTAVAARAGAEQEDRNLGGVAEVDVDGGCAFPKAVAEYHDPANPVHQAVLANRQWFLDTITRLMAEVRRESSEAAACHYVMLREGAMVAGCLADPASVGLTFLRGVDGLVRAHAEPRAS